MELFVFARLHACPGRQAGLLQAMFEVQGATRPEAGCLAYGGFRSVRDQGEFYIHSRWRDQDAFDRHAALPHTVRFLASIEPRLDHAFKGTLAEQLW
jgi:quinol monooxygenase YgiN